MKQRVILCCVLQDGQGDIGNMLAFLRALQAQNAAYKTTCVILCLQHQLASIQKTCQAIPASLATFQYYVCPEERVAYRRGDLAHYDVPAPGVPSEKAEIIALCEQATHVFVFPVVYPFLKEIVGRASDRTWQFLEYGRSLAENLPPRTLAMGVRPHEKGIVFHAKGVFASSKALDPEVSKLLLGEARTHETYLKNHALAVCYFKRTPQDPQLVIMKHFLMMSLFLVQRKRVNIDIFCPDGILGLEPFYPFLFEFGIKDVQRVTPTGAENPIEIIMESFDAGLQKRLANKKKPEHRLRLFVGFKSEQSHFLSLLALSTQSAWPSGYLPMGACGDGSTTDVLSLAYYTRHIGVLPVIQPVTTYHYETLQALEGYAHSLEGQHKEVWRVLFHVSTCTPFEVLALCQTLEREKEQGVLRRLLQRLYEHHNIVHALKRAGLV